MCVEWNLAIPAICGGHPYLAVLELRSTHVLTQFGSGEAGYLMAVNTVTTAVMLHCRCFCGNGYTPYVVIGEGCMQI